ncbi:MAG: hypothetical protein M1816_000590 [Peltula sp. TS41687]|nr:MAG: hypothetical protein M1816_000590 [Peltula sp. TS41687]
MATASKVSLSLTDRGVFHCPGIIPESAKKASELLQENHDRTHIFFNEEGLHNHIAHHLLTLYALASSPSNIQRQYEKNRSYQRPIGEVNTSSVKAMHDPANFKKYLGKEKHYHDYLVFFQEEIEKKGWEAVLNEYLFQRDERADDMLVRTFMGFLHPFIHLGFGVEFRQPAIIAEALAQAAIHGDWLAPFFVGAEEAAQKSEKPGGRSLVSLLNDVRADQTLSSSAKWEDGNKIRDGILKRAPEEMIRYASQWKVAPNELERKTAEMINAAVYYTGCAQRPPKVVKFDFYFLHCVNSSIFFSTFLNETWLSPENKVRLLEWKGRLDLAMYVSRASPQLLIDEVINYQPKHPSGPGGDPWGPIFDRVGQKLDDGHSSKLIRALANGQEVCAPYEDREEFPIKANMWLQLGHMVIDSVERDNEDTWVRSAGFDQAWKEFAEREKELVDRTGK